jgi:energy-converting hydrogenase B subunit D
VIWALDIVLLCFLVLLSIIVVFARDLLVASIVLSVYSLIMAIMFTQLNAPDVALTEATVGAGISTILFVVTIAKTTRREED